MRSSLFESAASFALPRGERVAGCKTNTGNRTGRPFLGQEEQHLCVGEAQLSARASSVLSYE